MTTLRLLTAGALAIAASAAPLLAGAGLPVGHYVGHGEWIGVDGTRGEYRTELTIAPERFTATSTWEQNGQPVTRSHSVGLVPRGAGFFDLVDDDGTVLGQLACHDDRCTYSLEQNGADVRESFVFEQDELVKFGGKTSEGYRVAWTERLTQE
jgi:hypothetical protein